MFLLLTFLFFTSLLFSEELNFEATVDRTSLPLDETLTFTLRISGGDLNAVPNPRVPDFKNFNVVNSYTSQSISIINGVVSASRIINLVLLPSKIGKFTIPPAQLNYRGKEYKTTEIAIEVTQAIGRQRGAQPAPQARQPIPQPSVPSIEDKDVEGNIFIKTSIDKKKIYVNQQVILTVSFYRRVRLWENPVYKPPELTGFWVEELPRQKQSQIKIVNGVKYLVDEIKTAIFPVAEGEVTIGSASIECMVDPFSGPIVLKTKPIKIKVLSLPPTGQAIGDKKAVGKYTISAKVDKTATEQDQPVNLTIKINGVGNIKTVQEPDIEIPEQLKKYTSKSTENISRTADSVSGEKVFEYVLVPKVAGKFVIKGINFYFFNPDKEVYEKVSTNPINIEVKGGKIGSQPYTEFIYPEDSAKLVMDIKHIKILDDVKRQELKLYKNKYYLLLHLLPVALLLVAGFVKKNGIASQKYTIGRTMRDFKRVRKIMKKDKKNQFYAELQKTVFEFFAEKFNIPSSEITIIDIIENLKNSEIDDKIINEFKENLQKCDFERFTPSSSGDIDEMRKVYVNLINSIKFFNKALRRLRE